MCNHRTMPQNVSTSNPIYTNIDHVASHSINQPVFLPQTHVQNEICEETVRALALQCVRKVYVHLPYVNPPRAA